MSQKKPISALITLSILVFIGLCWFIYLAPKGETSLAWVSQLPLLNCTLNSLSAICLIAGFRAIMAKKETQHKQWMLSAFGFSTLFLISYLFYHHFHGDTLFTGVGWTRPVYFFTLISHILLTLVGLPLILITFFYALTNRFTEHKKIARWTFPIWLYISVTGVCIYVFQQLWQ